MGNLPLVLFYSILVLSKLNDEVQARYAVQVKRRNPLQNKVYTNFQDNLTIFTNRLKLLSH